MWELVTLANRGEGRIEKWERIIIGSMEEGRIVRWKL